MGPRTTRFFLNDTTTTEIYTLSLHDALPIFVVFRAVMLVCFPNVGIGRPEGRLHDLCVYKLPVNPDHLATLKLVDRKSTRLNSSHANISSAVFCLQKKITYRDAPQPNLTTAC